MVVTFFEIIFFSLNEGINIHWAKTTDMGGSVVVHTFGAYFGLAASWVLTPEGSHESKDNSSTKTSDLFSMVGTLFLWMFWPSFNSAIAAPSEQQRIVVNTVLSIVGSMVAAFIASQELRKGKFNMVDIQNATLAGGVAIGASCSMAVGPGGALTTGIVAGLLSTIGFTKISPMLEKCGIYDTCGIHNLHGMPGVMAGISATIMAAIADVDAYKNQAQLTQTFPARFDSKGGELRTAGEQAGYQFAYLIITLAIAISSGVFTGYVCKWIEPAKTVFDDTEAFDVPDETDLIRGWVEVASPSSRMLRRRKAADMDVSALDIES